MVPTALKLSRNAKNQQSTLCKGNLDIWNNKYFEHQHECRKCKRYFSTQSKKTSNSKSMQFLLKNASRLKEEKSNLNMYQNIRH